VAKDVKEYFAKEMELLNEVEDEMIYKTLKWKL